MVLYGAPTEAHEWRLVTVRGRIDTVRKLGDRWRAELVVGRDSVVVVGQSGAGIPVASVLTGPIRDRDRHRPSAVPDGDGPAVRDPAARAADVRVDPGSSTGSGRIRSRRRLRTGLGVGPGRSRPGPRPAAASSRSAPGCRPRDLAALAGRTVRVGGLVGDLLPGGFTLDDGTAIGTIVFEGAAPDLLPLIEPGDAINVVGRVESTDRWLDRRGQDPAGVVLAGDPVAPDRASTRPRTARPRPGAAAARAATPLGAGMDLVAGPDAGHRGARDAGRADGRLGRRDGPPATPSATIF